MKTLQIQTTIRPNQARKVEYNGSLRKWWNSPGWAVAVVASRLAITWDDPDNGSDLVFRRPVVVRFTGTTTYSLITVYDAETGARLDDSEWPDDYTQLEIMGVACDVSEEYRVIQEVQEQEAASV